MLSGVIVHCVPPGTVVWDSHTHTCAEVTDEAAVFLRNEVYLTEKNYEALKNAN